MKRTLSLSLILLVGILLTGCGEKVEENKNLDNQNVNIEENSNSNIWELSNNQNDETLSSNTDVVDCEKMIQNYLEGADKDWQWDGIKEWDNIVVDYIWRLEDWTVFDTSIESIAKACGKYNEYRDYTQWLSFEVWVWQMIKWFDNGVIWMKLWQTKTVKFWPEEGYGQRNEQYIITYTADEIWNLSAYNVWDIFQPNPYTAGVITKITDKEMVVDLNHELAWKDLIFDITIKSIN